MNKMSMIYYELNLRWFLGIIRILLNNIYETFAHQTYGSKPNVYHFVYIFYQWRWLCILTFCAYMFSTFNFFDSLNHHYYDT